MTLDNFEHLAERLLPAVLRSGAVIMQHRDKGVAVESKSDASPVTAADRDAEEIILEALARAAAGVPVIAEEMVSSGKTPAVSAEFFLVDPLDGTREFVRGGTDFTINIGLVQDRRPRFGIIYAPATGQLFLTSSGRRAAECRVEPAAQVSRLSELRLEEIVTREPDLSRIAAVASRSHLTADTRRFLERHAVADYLTIGSSLKFCLLARGEADLYPRFGPTSEWDTAAGHAILLAAGGEVTAVDGGPFEYGNADAGFLNPGFIAWGRRSLIRTFLG